MIDLAADNQNKPITELHAEFKEPEFPGFLNFRKPPSEIAGLPKPSIAILKQRRTLGLLRKTSTRARTDEARPKNPTGGG
jgi:hypothetical protein